MRSAMKVSARVGPLVLVVVGLVLAVGFGRAWRGDLAGATAPWWAYLFLMLLAIAMLALAAAVSIDPRPLQLRQSLAGAAPRLARRPHRPRHRGGRRLARDPGGMAVRGPRGRRRICAGGPRGDDASDRGAVRRYRSVPAPGRRRRLRRGDLHGDRGSGHRREPRARHLAVHRPGRAGRPAAVGSRRGHRDPAGRHVRDRRVRHAVAHRVGRSRSRRPRTGGTASCSSSPWSGSWPRPRR